MARRPLKLMFAAGLVFCSCLYARAEGQATPAAPQPDSPDAQQPPAPKLSLDEAIRTARREHPGLRQAQEAIVAAQARSGQARSGYFPQVTTSGFAKQGLSGASGALGLRGLVTSPLFRDIGASSAAFQNLYDFGRTSHQVKASRWAVVSLEHVLTAARNAVVLAVQQAYYDALEQQRLIEVNEKVLADRRLITRQADVFYRTGLKSKVDLTLAEVGAANANLELVKARDRLRTAFAELNHAMGIDGQAAYSLEEPVITVQAPPALDRLLEESLRQRPELSAFDGQIKSDEEIVSRAESSRWPRFMALFSGGWVRFSELTPGRLLLGAFGLDLPVWDGGRIKNEIAEARAALARTRAARDETAQDVRLQVQRAHSEVLSAMESVRATQQLIAQAREALRLARVRYRVQLGSFVELTSADAASSDAEAQHAKALYRYKAAESLLNYVAGRR